MRMILGRLGVDVISQKEAGLELEVEETGYTYAENAFLKADGACRAANMPAIADDSGLSVDALDGAPGVYSARFGGAKTDKERVALLLKSMEGKTNRNARFVSSIACVFPNGDVIRAQGECMGTISHEPAGSGGFGYDPVFLLPEYGLSMAQITQEEKNAVSHRGKALRAFAEKLEEYLKAREKAD